jgi:hypothetical protein
LNDPRRAHLQQLRYRNRQRLRCRKVEYEIELRRQLDGDVGRTRALEDLVDDLSQGSEFSCPIGAVGSEAAGFGELGCAANRGEAKRCRLDRKALEL